VEDFHHSNKSVISLPRTYLSPSFRIQALRMIALFQSNQLCLNHQLQRAGPAAEKAGAGKIIRS
jgi:hypothetical protein